MNVVDEKISKLVSVVVPAYNEEHGIIKSIEDLKRHLPYSEIIVVDDASTDNTFNNTKNINGIVLLSHLFNRGYGAALKTGMQKAGRPYIAWFDADNEHRAVDLKKMLFKIVNSRNAAVIGERSYSTSSLRVFGKWIIRGIARLMGVRLGKDINCGLRVFRRSVITRYLGLLPDTYSASLTSTMIMIGRGYPFSFYPIDVNKRIGESKVRVTHAFQTLVFVLRIIMLFTPLKIFFPLGFTLVMVGGGYGVLTALMLGLGLPVLSVLLVILGIFSLTLGAIADQISQMRLIQLTMNGDGEYQWSADLTEKDRGGKND